jgi:TonB-linked SusC/RagA family outer membrane protein
MQQKPPPINGRTTGRVRAGGSETPGSHRPAIRRACVSLLVLLLLVGVLPAGLAAQDAGTVVGTVVAAATQRPLAGVQVTVVGTQLGTDSDSQGRFLIRGVPPGSHTIRAMLIGYAARTEIVNVQPGEAASVDFALGLSALELDGIVVTGTVGGQQRRALGTSLAAIDAATVVEQQPVATVGELLRARAAGVALTTQGGSAGAGSQILIRGPGSFAFSGNPLVYVDGVRVNATPLSGRGGGGAGAPSSGSRLDDISPSDIESIEIIRGPAAATLYGSEASAGVIQIITKRGVTGRPSFNVRVRQGANWFHNAAERMPTTWGVNPSTGQVESLNVVAREAAEGNPVFRTGHLSSYAVNVSGGTDEIRYYSGIDLSREEGVIPGNDSELFTGRLNLGFAPRATMDADVGLSFARGDTRTFHANYLGTMFYSTPRLLNSPNRGFLLAPPEAYREIFNYSQEIDRYQARATVRHRPLDWLTHRLTTGLDVSGERRQDLRPVTPAQWEPFFSSSFNRGGKSVSRTNSTYGTVDYSATADWHLTSNLASSTSFGGQYHRTFSRFESISGEEFPSEGIITIAGASRVSGSETFLEEVSVGLFVQQQFAWRDRLYVTAAVRADDHSAFGAEFELVTYPKLMVSWVVTEEPFWTFSPINTLRLRGAFGESGQQPATFAAIRTYTPVTGSGDLPAGSPAAPGNPDLGPERGREVELGFDAALLDDRVSMEFTYYNQRTNDVIVQRSVAPSEGFTGAQFINAGEVQNRGLEALVRATPYATGPFIWDVTANLSRNSNEVLSLGVDADFIPSGWLPNRHQVGFPLNAYFRKRIISAELDASGNLINVLCDGGTGRQGVEPGGVAVACAAAPMLFVGKPYADWTGSLGTSVTLFQRLRLSGLLEYQYGAQIFESTQYWNCANLLNHEIVFHPDRYPAERVAECRMGLDYIGTTRIQDSGYTKLRELSLNYQLPSQWASQLGASRASITLAGRNLFTWTSFDGLDPEAVTPVNWMGGLHTELMLPLPRTFMTTVNVSF